MPLPRTSSTRTVFALLSLCALGACASAPPLPTATAEVSTIGTELDPATFSLGPNDVVSVSVYGHPELSTPRDGNFVGTRVDPDGTLSLPLIGPVDVAGLDLAEARVRIVEAYAQYVKDPHVDLSVVEWSSRRFYLYGEVEEPGAYALDRPLNVYQALTFGGGFSKAANTAEIVLLRGTPENLEVFVVDGEDPHLSGLVAIHPDDFLFVRKSGAGRFADEVLPILTGISSSLSSVATVLLIEDRLNE